MTAAIGKGISRQILLTGIWVDQPPAWVEPDGTRAAVSKWGVVEQYAYPNPSLFGSSAPGGDRTGYCIESEEWPL